MTNETGRLAYVLVTAVLNLTRFVSVSTDTTVVPAAIPSEFDVTDAPTPIDSVSDAETTSITFRPLIVATLTLLTVWSVV